MPFEQRVLRNAWKHRLERASARLPFSLGDRVAVIGLGVVGQLIAQLVRLQGGVVIAIDLKPDRVELARTLGADCALTSGSSLRESVLTFTNGVLR